MYPTEVVDVLQAMNTVENNVWYGYKHDLGPVRSTRYKNLAYVAKEVLIKIEERSSLTRYMGWIRRAQYQAAVDIMI